MKIKGVIILSVAILLSLGFFINIRINDGKGHEQPKLPFMAFWEQLKRNQIKGKFDTKDYLDARIAFEKFSKKGSVKSLGLNWVDLGPHNVGGRTRAILIDQANANHMFAGGVSGGLFESMDAGLTWQVWPGSDTLRNLNISAMAQAANGDIYFGTGEITPAYPDYAFPGAGLFKSTDGGHTFKQIKITKPNGVVQSSAWSFINKIACDPTNAQKVYVATANGLYVSENATADPNVIGTSWTDANGIYFNKRASFSNAGNVFDVKTGSDGRVVATQPGTNANLFISTDGGQTFGQFPIMNGSSQKALITISPLDPNYIYVATLKNNVQGGVFQTKDGGTSWAMLVPAASATGGGFNPYGNQGYYDMCIAAAIDNKEKLWIAGQGDVYQWDVTGWHRVASGYASAGPTSYVHPDHHILYPHPNNANILYLGNDGGVYVGNQMTTTHSVWADRNRGYSPTQFYDIGAGQLGEIIGGSQDNGTNYNDYYNNTPTSFRSVLGGDGFMCAIGKLNPKAMFASVYTSDEANKGGEEIYRSLNGGVGFSSCGDQHLLPETGYFLTRISLQEKLTLPTAAKLFWASTTGIWMTNQPFAGSPTWYKINTGNISSAYRMVSSPDLNHVYIGTENGRLYRISGLNNATYPPANYTTFVPATAGITTTLIYQNIGRFITGIAVHPDKPDSILVSMANYGNTSFTVKILNAQTSSGTSTTGANPTISASIQGNMPAFPVYDIAINPTNTQQVLLGTEYGIFTSNNAWQASPLWSEDNNGFPRVPTMKLIFAPDTIGRYYLYAGTHGRGAFYSKSLCNNCPDIETNKGPFSATKDLKATEISINAFPNPVADLLTIETPNLVSIAHIKIYNLEGRIMLNTKVAQNWYQVKTASWPVGTYMIISSVADKNILTKVVKN
jgi:hypothetical protein